MKITERIILACAIVCTTSLAALSQNTGSPFSMYGYGLLGDRATSMQRQMGGVGYAMNSGRQINVMNPASYAAIDSLTFLFDIGADLSMIHTTEGDISENKTGGGLDYITMQFPITKYMGASLGMVPYTSVGYSFGNDIEHGARSIQGSGGINEAYLGLAGKLGPVSIGFNLSYNFGNIRNDVYSTPSYGQSLFEHFMEIRDWNINFGLQYTARIKKYDKLVFGATYSPKKSMRGKSWVTIQELSFESTPDTLGYLRLKDNYEQPHSIGAGISYSHEKNSRFLIEVDFTYQDWANAKFSPVYNDKGQLLFEGMKFNNRYKGAIGAEYVPKLRGNYLQKMAYRIGGYYNRDYLNINGNELKEFGMSCGFGFPTPEGKTIINLGFEFKRRYCSPVNLLSENYFNITLGVNFNELWFWQRKLR